MTITFNMYSLLICVIGLNVELCTPQEQALFSSTVVTHTCLTVVELTHQPHREGMVFSESADLDLHCEQEQ